jgi:hypothetical protein
VPAVAAAGDGYAACRFRCACHVGSHPSRSIRIKHIAKALAATLALGSTFALAQTYPAPRPVVPTDNAAAPADSDASGYWSQHAKGGYMTREDTINYRNGNMQGASNAGGPAVDYSQIDTNHDGRTSQSEWMAWQRGARSGSMDSGSGTSSGSPRGSDQGAAGRNNNNNTGR